MFIRTVKNFLVLIVVTNFGVVATAGQGTKMVPQNETSKVFDLNPKYTKSDLPMELKNLPVLLDSRRIQFDDNVRTSTFNLDALMGPGSGGGGNICAQGIATAVKFIRSNLDLIPFANSRHRENFEKSLVSVEYRQGGQLELRGQPVNAINYPAYKLIVLDSAICASLAEGSPSAYSLLVHEHLGIAGIDDRSYQISTVFSKKVAPTLMLLPNMERMKKAVIKKFLTDVKNPQSDLSKLLKKVNDDTIDGRNREGSLIIPESELDLQVVLLSRMEIEATWDYGSFKNGVCTATGEEADYRIFLGGFSNMRGGNYLHTYAFDVQVRRILRMKVKGTKSCNDFLESDSYASLYGPTTEEIEVDSISYVEPK